MMPVRSHLKKADARELIKCFLHYWLISSMVYVPAVLIYYGMKYGMGIGVKYGIGEQWETILSWAVMVLLVVVIAALLPDICEGLGMMFLGGAEQTRRASYWKRLIGLVAFGLYVTSWRVFFIETLLITIWLVIPLSMTYEELKEFKKSQGG